MAFNNGLTDLLALPQSSYKHSSGTDSRFPGSLAFNNDISSKNSTGWWTVSPYGTNQWISIDFLKNVTVNYIKIENGWVTSAVKNIIIQKSIDGVVWVDVKSAILAYSDGEQIINISPTMSRYWRIYVVDGYNVSYVSLAEIEFYGEVSSLYLIKKDDDYFSIASQFYDTVNKVYVKIVKTDANMTFIDFLKKNSFQIYDMNLNMDTGVEIFKPIDKISRPYKVCKIK